MSVAGLIFPCKKGGGAEARNGSGHNGADRDQQGWKLGQAKKKRKFPANAKPCQEFGLVIAARMRTKKLNRKKKYTGVCPYRPSDFSLHAI